MPSPQKVKGKSFENAKAKFLTEIYGEKFIRVPTSGAFLGGQNYDRRHTMSQGQIMAFKGDIIPPDDFVSSSSRRTNNLSCNGRIAIYTAPCIKHT